MAIGDRSYTVAALSVAGAIAFAGCAPFAGANGQGGAGASTPGGAATAQRTPPAEVAGVQAGAQRAVGASAAARVYQEAGESVVNITSLAVARSPFGSQQGSQPQPRGTGSGFVIDDRGHIATNNHVVEDADQLSVTFPNKTTVPATLVGRDPDNDLAVIRVDPAARDAGGRTSRSCSRR